MLFVLSRIQKTRSKRQGKITGILENTSSLMPARRRKKSVTLQVKKSPMGLTHEMVGDGRPQI